MLGGVIPEHGFLTLSLLTMPSLYRPGFTLLAERGVRAAFELSRAEIHRLTCGGAGTATRVPTGVDEGESAFEFAGALALITKVGDKAFYF